MLSCIQYLRGVTVHGNISELSRRHDVKCCLPLRYLINKQKTVISGYKLSSSTQEGAFNQSYFALHLALGWSQL